MVRQVGGRARKDSLDEPLRCLFDREDITDRLRREITCPAIVIHVTPTRPSPWQRHRAWPKGLPAANPWLSSPVAPMPATSATPIR